MKFAVSLPPFTDPTTLVELGVAAERAGWDGVFVWDHVQWDTHRQLPVHDPWALLSAMAMCTERIALGSGVTPLARRRPWILAKQVVTLDHLSGGRVVLGVGLGDPGDADFGVFGDEPTYAGRAAIVDEALPLLDGLLRGEPVVHHGAHYDVEAHLRPPPVQRPRPPIIVAGTYSRRAPLARALRYDGYFPIAYRRVTPDQLAASLEGVERPPGWRLFVGWTSGIAASEFEAAGVDWLVEGGWPEGDWVDALRRRIDAGPLG